MPTFFVYPKGGREYGKRVTAETSGKARYAAWRDWHDFARDLEYRDLRCVKVSDADGPSPEAIKQRAADLAAECWNACHQIGSPVLYWPGLRDTAEPRLGQTRSRAWVLGGHTAVVLCTGHAGAIALSHVEAVEEAP